MVLNMKRQYDMKIKVENRHPLIIFTHKITKKTVQRKNKAQTVNIFYMTILPKELQAFMEILNNEIFFYQKDNTVYITSRPPSVDYHRIKIQKNNQISIPKKYFNPAQYTSVIYTLNLGAPDGWRHGRLGLLSMELK